LHEKVYIKRGVDVERYSLAQFCILYLSRFNGHFPGEPGLAGFIGARMMELVDDRGGGDVAGR